MLGMQSTLPMRDPGRKLGVCEAYSKIHDCLSMLS